MCQYYCFQTFETDIFIGALHYRQTGKQLILFIFFPQRIVCNEMIIQIHCIQTLTDDGFFESEICILVIVSFQKCISNTHLNGEKNKNEINLLEYT